MSNHTLKIAYLSAENPKNKKVWSGTHYSIYKCLCEVGEVEILGPYTPKIHLFIAKIINQILLFFFSKRYDYRHSKFISNAYAKYFKKKLKNNYYNFIVAPAASCEVANLITNIPIIYITDGTFYGCLNYHKSLKNLIEKSIVEGNCIEQQTLNKSKFVIVSSEWAMQSVIKDYSIDSGKVITIPFGANFELLPTIHQLNLEIPKTWKILFVGVYWENKGGEIAYNAFISLINKGYDVNLTILGCIPPDKFQHPKITVIPFIDKNEKAGQKKLFDIYKQHHFLILPTRFDCTPIVINEASAFAMPCLVANTGGVAGHLTENENGYLINYNDKGEGYAEKISFLMTHPDLYLKLRQTTRKKYDESLNWQNWKEKITSLMRSKSPD